MYTVTPIAHIETDFPTKFGIPRQSGIDDAIRGRIVFEPRYRDSSATRGIEGFSHIWILWLFSENEEQDATLTVRPPRLGGNRRVGVFASRSPFRPNRIGLSCVKLLSVSTDPQLGTVLEVAGADMVDGTPVLDIKPYLPYTDCHPDATSGYVPQGREAMLSVDFPEELLSLIPEDKRAALHTVLSQDPRPGYSSDPRRVYGVPFSRFDVRFTVDDTTATLTVTDVLYSK